MNNKEIAAYDYYTHKTKFFRSIYAFRAAYFVNHKLCSDQLKRLNEGEVIRVSYCFIQLKEKYNEEKIKEAVENFIYKQLNTTIKKIPRVFGQTNITTFMLQFNTVVVLEQGETYYKDLSVKYNQSIGNIKSKIARFKEKQRFKQFSINFCRTEDFMDRFKNHKIIIK